MLGDMSENETYDVVVIGGGAAGLSGAMALGRSKRSVLVVDAREPRNAPAGHAHNYLGREGVRPLELLEDGRAEVAAYGVEVVTDRVVGLSGGADSFLVTTEGGRRYGARRVLVTGGVVDELPDVPGLAERWGVDVLHCPYCHGWEVRDQPLAILATNFQGEEQGRAFGVWAAASGIAPIIGPFIGGLLVDELSWRWIFIINVPLILVALWAAQRHIKESRDETASDDFDWIGALLVGLAVGGLSFGAIYGQQRQWQRHRHALRDHARDGRLVGEAGAQVPRQHAAEPALHSSCGIVGRDDRSRAAQLVKRQSQGGLVIAGHQRSTQPLYAPLSTVPGAPMTLSPTTSNCWWISSATTEQLSDQPRNGSAAHSEGAAASIFLTRTAVSSVTTAASE